PPTYVVLLCWQSCTQVFQLKDTSSSPLHLQSKFIRSERPYTHLLTLALFILPTMRLLVANSYILFGLFVVGGARPTGPANSIPANLAHSSANSVLPSAELSPSSPSPAPPANPAALVPASPYVRRTVHAEDIGRKVTVPSPKDVLSSAKKKTHCSPVEFQDFCAEYFVISGQDLAQNGLNSTLLNPRRSAKRRAVGAIRSHTYEDPVHGFRGVDSITLIVEPCPGGCKSPTGYVKELQRDEPRPLDLLKTPSGKDLWHGGDSGAMRSDKEDVLGSGGEEAKRRQVVYCSGGERRKEKTLQSRMVSSQMKMEKRGRKVPGLVTRVGERSVPSKDVLYSVSVFPICTVNRD
ncbi:hypothetical protein F5878DRAFT_676111, partial [Lentinula raphanica]